MEKVGNDMVRFSFPWELAAARRAKRRALLEDLAAGLAFALVVVEIVIGLWLSSLAA